MAMKTKSCGIAMVALVAALVAGCATSGTPSGTPKQVTAADAKLFAGTWQGMLYPAQGGGVSSTLIVNADGSYSTQGGAFLSFGKVDIKDGYVHFVSTSGTGVLGSGNRSGSATLMDRGASWGLVGSGFSERGGPFNFDFNKAK